MGRTCARGGGPMRPGGRGHTRVCPPPPPRTPPPPPPARVGAEEGCWRRSMGGKGGTNTWGASRGGGRIPSPEKEHLDQEDLYSTDQDDIPRPGTQCGGTWQCVPVKGVACNPSHPTTTTAANRDTRGSERWVLVPKNIPYRPLAKIS
eukprot:gene2712-biopygen6544